MMKRDEMLKAFARQRKDEIVVAVYTAAQEITHIQPNDLNYTFVGAMGQGSSHALGLALGRPDKKVIVFDGDGSLLMNLGSLVTIGAVAPRNLVHFVCQNGNYEANGSHPLPNPKVDFTGLARSAGYAKCHEFSELASFEQQIGHVLGEDGPVFATLHIERTRPLTYDYPALYAAEKRRALKAELKRTTR